MSTEYIFCKLNYRKYPITDREMLTEFNDEIFEKFVSKIVIINRNMAEFHLKCGLKLKENL